MTSTARGPLSYHAPPNWPTPPPGWTPPSGWSPDPAWGPAPRGWDFWRPDPYPTGRYEGIYRTYRTEHERAAGNALTLSVLSVLVPFLGFALGVVGMVLGGRALRLARAAGGSTTRARAAILVPPIALATYITLAVVVAIAVAGSD